MGVLKDLQRLAEQQADVVMLGIEYLTMQLTDTPNPALSQRIPREMLDHLYELHRLRDIQLMCDIDDECVRRGEFLIGTALWELNNA